MTHDDPAFLQELLSVKVDIRDGAALARLNEAGLSAYLAAHGWRKAGNVPYQRRSADQPALGSEWVKGEKLVFVPAGHIGDRSARTSDLLANLEITEQRSQLLIYRDLLLASQAAGSIVAPVGER